MTPSSLRTPWMPALAVAVYVALRLAAIHALETPHRDDAIAYLAATGHEGEYDRVVENRTEPYGTWVPAKAWKRFLLPEDRFCFRTIGLDLAATDIHPPLYFWLLHVWTLILGLHLWSGPALNLLLGLATLVALAGFAGFVLGTPRAGWMVAVVWASSATVIPVTLAVRQYEFAALWTVLYLWEVFRWTRTEVPITIPRVVLLAATVAGGLLTHYPFLLVLVPGVVLLTVRLGRGSLRRLVAALGAMAAGVLVFVALHPHFWESILRARSQSGGVSFLGWADRLDLVLVRYASFFFPVEVFSGWARSALTVLLLVGSVLAVRWLWRAPKKGSLAGHHVLWCLAFLVGAHVALFLSGKIPAHAMAARHQAMMWPLVAFLPVLFAQTFRRREGVVSALVVASMVAGGVTAVAVERPRETQISRFWDMGRPQQRLLLDNVMRSVLLPVVWDCRDGMPVYAADPVDLVAHEDNWFLDLGDGDIWLSPSKTIRADRRRLRRILGQQFVLPPGEGPALVVLRDKTRRGRVR